MLCDNQTPQLQDQQKTSTHNHKCSSEEARFWRVVQQLQQYGLEPIDPLVGCNSDPESREYQLASSSITFVMAVESATREALRGTNLIDSWKRLVVKKERRVSPDTEQRIISLCAPAYEDLEPECYFMPAWHAANGQTPKSVAYTNEDQGQELQPPSARQVNRR